MKKRLFLTALLAMPMATDAGFSDMLKQGADMLNGGTPGATDAASALPTSEIDAGLKEALSIGAERAIDYLSKPGGFLNDPKVRIGLPGSLGTIAQGLRAAGQGAIVDEFEETMNRAAEAAIPRTLDIVKETVSNMTLDDARQILSGGDDAATQYLLLLCHIMSCVRGAMWLSLTHCFIKVFYDDLAKFPLPPWKRPFSGSQITSTLILSHFRNFCHLAPAASVAHSTAISVDYSRHLVGACYA